MDIVREIELGAAADVERIVQLLVTERRAQRMTQARLARKSGISRTAVRNIEHGRRTSGGNVVTLARIARALRLKITLTTWDG